MAEHDNSIFGGSVPQVYQKYLSPLIFEEYADDLVGRVNVPEGGAVLETACGTGIVTRRLLAKLPASVRLTATDLNPDMMAVAQEMSAGNEAVEFQTADATNLEYPDNSFDAVVCQFGVMFFPDKGQGYREAARVLKPGGSFVFNVWDSLERNPFAGMGNDVVHELIPEDPPAFLQIPFGYHDLYGISSELQAAGFADVDIFVMPRVSRAPSARDAATAFVLGTPLAPLLAQRGIQDAALERLESNFIERFGEGPVAAPMQAIAFVAKKLPDA
jgi:ubiquinone/menaquinone biosynthesis C-methylase UbiE